MPTWNAYRCQRLQHFMLVFESMDSDTETRRLSPIALHGGNTGAGNYTDMINGPMDHGEWPAHRTCACVYWYEAQGTAERVGQWKIKGVRSATCTFILL